MFAMRVFARRSAQIATAALLVATLSSCGAPTPDEYFERAQQYAAQGDLNAAVVELKNALVGDGTHGPARLMLGEIYAQRGEFPQALKELERALDLGQPDDQVLPPLMLAKLGASRHQEVIGELEDRADLTPYLEAILGDAYLYSGDATTAENLYGNAVARDPQLGYGHVGIGKVRMGIGNTAGAAKAFAKAVELDPADRTAWLLYGENALTRRDVDIAYAAYDAARKLPGGELIGAVGYARALLIDDKLDNALVEIDGVLKRAPNYPVAHYLRGLVLFQQGDLENAELSIQQVQAVAPDHPGSLYLNGAIKYRLGKPAQARDQLSRYLSVDPRNESVRKLLASMYYEDGDFAAVTQTLEPVAANTQDAQLLAMLGTGYLNTGDQSKASANFERAVQLQPDLASLRNQLALSLLSSGDRAGAEAELAAAVELDGEQFQSDYLIAMIHVQEGDQDAARVAVDRLLEKDPDQPIGFNLRGSLKIAAGDVEGAVADFELALEKDPAFEPAARNLSAIAIRDEDYARAERIWSGVLEASGDSVPAMIALAQLGKVRGDDARQKQMLRRAVNAAGDNALPRFLLAEQLIAERNLAEARAVVEGGLQAAPESLNLILLNARLFSAEGRPSSARAQAGRAQSLLTTRRIDLEKVPQTAHSLGAAWMNAGEQDSAIAALEAANTGFEGRRPDTIALLVRLYLSKQDTVAARQRLDALRQLELPANSLLELEGDLLATENQPEQALERYEALADTGARNGVTKRAMMLERMGRTDDARQVMRDWLQSNPADAGMKLLMANSHLTGDEPEQALDIYEDLVESDSPLVLNNLAWLYHERGNDRALELARRAHELAPENADIADTLGWILVQTGSVSEGMEYLKQSIAAREQNASVQYHLAVAHHRSGDLHSARTHLRKALNLGAFPEADEARALLKDL